jgi:hypothetical protein
VLELPDVAELVDDEILVDTRALQQNQVAGGVAAEAPEPGNREQPRRHDQPDTVEIDRLGIER